MSASETRALGAGLAEALRDIHRAGLVHRDLKPGNVMLAADGPRLIDFGIIRAADGAGLTETGYVLGSAGFMAPEQAAGGEANAAADVYSLGAVLTFASTGHGPFVTVRHRECCSDRRPGTWTLQRSPKDCAMSRPAAWTSFPERALLRAPSWNFSAGTLQRMPFRFVPRTLRSPPFRRPSCAPGPARARRGREQARRRKRIDARSANSAKSAKSTKGTGAAVPAAHADSPEVPPPSA